MAVPVHRNQLQTLVHDVALSGVQEPAQAGHVLIGKPVGDYQVREAPPYGIAGLPTKSLLSLGIPGDHLSPVVNRHKGIVGCFQDHLVALVADLQIGFGLLQIGQGFGIGDGTRDLVSHALGEVCV